MTKLLAIVAVTAVVAVPAAAARAATNPWHTVKFADQAAGVSLDAVAALTPSDVWAGGGSSTHQPVFEHWNGISWTHVDGQPLSGVQSADVAGVRVLPAGVWAVGTAQVNDYTLRGFVEHSADDTTWTVQNLPAYFELNAIAGTSTTNLWAVGGDQNLQPVITHWDGASWKKSYTLVGAGGQFLSVTAIASNDVWAVGNTYTQGGNAVHPLLAHWNGKTWTRVTLPTAGTVTVEGGVAGSSATNVWTAGYSSGDPLVCIACDAVADTLTGGTWKPKSPPPSEAAHDELNAVATTGSSNVWTVGEQFNAAYDYSHPSTLLDHWDGKAWTSFVGPNVGTADDLVAITAIPGQPDSFIAVGTTKRGSVILHCC